MVFADTQGWPPTNPETWLVSAVILRELVSEAISKGVDLVLIPGDLVDGKCEESLKTTVPFSQLERRPIILPRKR